MSNEWENDATEFLRELVDECKLSLVLAGTSELDNLPEVAPHLSSRVSGRESMDNFIADANWVGFVRGFVKQCQSFDLTCMNDVQMAMRLHMRSEETRLNSSHSQISYAVFCLKKKKKKNIIYNNI